MCVGRYMASVNAPSPTRVAGQNNSNSFGMEGSYVNDQGYYTPSAGLNFATDGSDDGTIYFDSPDFTTISLGTLNQNYVTMTYHTTNSLAKRMIYVGEDCKIGKIVDGQLVAPHKCQKITALIEGVLVKDSSGNVVVDLDVLEDGNIQFITKEPPAKDAPQDVIDAEYPVFDINVQAQIQRVEGEIYASVWYIVTKTGVHSEGSVPA